MIGKTITGHAIDLSATIGDDFVDIEAGGAIDTVDDFCECGRLGFQRPVFRCFDRITVDEQRADEFSIPCGDNTIAHGGNIGHMLIDIGVIWS